jgi:hypothetical protein
LFELLVAQGECDAQTRGRLHVPPGANSRMHYVGSRVDCFCAARRRHS